MTTFHGQRSDEFFMSLALRTAEKYAGLTGPNPAVGCVLVRNGKIIASGAYKGQCFPHAEIAALKSVKNAADDCVLYVTLEPCCNFAKTPPCTDAIIRSGIKNVVVGCLDRNPAMSGKSVRILRQAGVHVKYTVLEKECDELNRAFFKYVRTGLPYVTLKIAMTLDGKIAPAPRIKQDKMITSFISRKQAHRLRLEHDAVLTGAGTVLADNPKLTVRHVPLPKEKKLYRVILDSRLRVPLDSNILKNQNQYPTLIATTKQSSKGKRELLQRKGVDVVVFPKANSGINIREVLFYLAHEKKLTSVLVEGGTGLNTSFLEGGYADSIVLFVSPWLMRGEFSVPAFLWSQKAKKLSLKNIRVQRPGTDIWIQGEIAKQMDDIV